MKTNSCRICLMTIASRGPGRRRTHHPECLRFVREFRAGLKGEKPGPKPKVYEPPVTHPVACFWCARVHSSPKEQHECHDRAHRAQREAQEFIR